MPLKILHLLGEFPLAFGLLSQILVVLASRKDGDRLAMLQSMVLIGALCLIMVSTLFRPKPHPNTTADLISVTGGVLLLFPAFEAWKKLRRQEKEEKGVGDS